GCVRAPARRERPLRRGGRRASRGGPPARRRARGGRRCAAHRARARAKEDKEEELTVPRLGERLEERALEGLHEGGEVAELVLALERQLEDVGGVLALRHADLEGR